MEQGIFACKYILSVGRQSGQHAKDEMKLQQFTRSRSIINQSLYSLPVQLAVVHSHARATSTYVDPYDYGPGGVERPFFLQDFGVEGWSRNCGKLRARVDLVFMTVCQIIQSMFILE